jgi:hypothetical protein
MMPASPATASVPNPSSTGSFGPLSGFSHHALMRLLRFQTTAKFARLTRSFKNPRKKVLSIVAVILGLMWVSQTTLSVLFRQPADPEQLAAWLPLGLLAYSLWHLIKISTRQFVEPFEWSGAEKEYVLAAPVSRAQQVTYRLASIAAAALAKAICFSILMSPDISIWMAGLVGMLLGLAFVDLIRVCFELFFAGLSKRGRFITQVIVVGFVSGCFLWAVGKCLLSPTAAEDLASPAALVFFKNLLGQIVGLSETSAGQILVAPFTLFTNVALVESIDGVLLLNGMLATALSVGTIAAVYRMDCWMNLRRQRQESANLSLGLAKRRQQDATGIVKADARVRVPFRWSGVGSIAWRQLLGVLHYRSVVIVSLTVPILLSCLPLLTNHTASVKFFNLIGGMMFYSFLLLPSALILDFRRDINKMSVLKALPINPLAMTFGQLATPVLMCSLFQTLVMVVACSFGEIEIWCGALAVILLLPVNVLIFAIENFIFLLAPYQRNKEGFDVFIRTILTFTGKGLLFAVGVGLTLAWTTSVLFVLNKLSLGPVAGTALFAAGLWVFTISVASAFVFAVARQFERFDPSQDTPGLG